MVKFQPAASLLCLIPARRPGPLASRRRGGGRSPGGATPRPLCREGAPQFPRPRGAEGARRPGRTLGRRQGCPGGQVAAGTPGGVGCGARQGGGGCGLPGAGSTGRRREREGAGRLGHGQGAVLAVPGPGSLQFPLSLLPREPRQRRLLLRLQPCRADRRGANRGGLRQRRAPRPASGRSPAKTNGPSLFIAAAGPRQLRAGRRQLAAPGSRSAPAPGSRRAPPPPPAPAPARRLRTAWGAPGRAAGAAAELSGDPEPPVPRAAPRPPGAP